jgi:hypothetical protein
MATVTQNLSGTVRASKFVGTTTPGAFDGEGSLLTSLTRANVAAGTADHVLINGGAGLMSSEARLAAARGGHGSISLALTPPYTYWNDIVGNVRPTDGVAVNAVLPAVIGATTGIFNPMGAAINSVPSTLVMRDSAGSINMTSTTIQYPTTLISISITGPSSVYDASAYVRTLASSVANVTTISPEAFSGSYALEATATINRLNTPASYGTIRILSRFRYNSGTNAWSQTSPFVEDHKSLDADLAGASLTLNTAGASAILVANGNAANVLDWTIKVRVLYQRTLAV